MALGFVFVAGERREQLGEKRGAPGKRERCSGGLILGLAGSVATGTRERRAERPALSSSRSLQRREVGDDLPFSENPPESSQILTNRSLAIIKFFCFKFPEPIQRAFWTPNKFLKI
jgi:hypothetical protein